MGQYKERTVTIKDVQEAIEILKVWCMDFGNCLRCPLYLAKDGLCAIDREPCRYNVDFEEE